MAAQDAAILQRYPIVNYIASFDASTGYGGYSLIPAQATAQCEALEREFGRAALETFHRSVLLTLISQYDERAAVRNYPPEIAVRFTAYLKGIVSQMERNPAGFYVHGNDRFAKDLAVCRHKLVPCGAQLVDICAGVPRSIAARQGISGAVRFLGYMLERVGGFKVLYQMHMDLRLILEFNPKGWEQCYVRIARLLERHRDVLGVYGTSWWFDPSLHGISPRLDFLRDLPQSGGARLFKVGTGDSSLDNALANSRERKAAYERGTYQPVDWLMVWSRKDLIAWADGREC